MTLIVKKSQLPKAGKGLYTKVPIKKGEKIIEYKGNDSWIEKTLMKARECLTDNRIPTSSKTCDYCNYTTALGDVLREQAKPSFKKIEEEKKPERKTKNKS